jgi:hypothetical protein
MGCRGLGVDPGAARLHGVNCDLRAPAAARFLTATPSATRQTSQSNSSIEEICRSTLLSRHGDVMVPALDKRENPMCADSKQEYLQHAETCLQLAGSVNDRNARLQLREMAAAWLQLVESTPSSQAAGIDLSRGA